MQTCHIPAHHLIQLDMTDHALFGMKYAVGQSSLKMIFISQLHLTL